MAAKVRIIGIEAVFDDEDGQWHCEDKRLLDLLNRLLACYEGSGADPNPALTIAQEAVDALGGEVLSWDDVPDAETEALLRADKTRKQ